MEDVEKKQDTGLKAGRIFNIQYFCVHDGPGIRTTVFLKGCPLRCLWCHNPEGIAKKKLLSFAERKCINCGACVQACPEVHKIVEGRHVINWDACTQQGACTKICITKALDIVGRDVTVEEVVQDVMREKRYYENGEGGVTVSGGEPAMQPDFLVELLRALKKEQVHVALETSGYCDYGIFESALPHVDLFLYDCKETNPELHKKFTGVDNARILDNLKKLHHAGANILLRCPVISGLNDREDHFKGIAALSRELENLTGVEILPYHKLAASKIERMGLEKQQEFEQIPREISNKWAEALRNFGTKVIDS
jgi:pyruvate formate lyase activating enzyme